MIARLITSVGATAAAVGLVIYGMGTAYIEPDDSLENLGIFLMVGGLIATVIGGAIYGASIRGSAEAAESSTPPSS